MAITAKSLDFVHSDFEVDISSTREEILTLELSDGKKVKIVDYTRCTIMLGLDTDDSVLCHSPQEAVDGLVRLFASRA